MRPLIPSLGAFTFILSAAWAQNAGNGASTQQLPVGQTFKNFEFPIYQDGQLKFTLNAAEATGITQNRADTTDVKIKLYDNGNVTTTVTSPKADLYVNERKLRTKSTVLIERSDMQATAQVCDFDLITKKYVLRTNVRVVLKNFDAGSGLAPSGSEQTTPGVSTTPTPAPSSLVPRPSLNDSLLDSPGAISSTNSAPLPPTNSDTK